MAGGRPVVCTITTATGTHQVAGTSATIGRDARSDVVIDDALVSRTHARVHRVGDVWMFEDAGSRNGTFVTDERVDSIPVRGTLRVYLGAPDGPWVQVDTGGIVAPVPLEARSDLGTVTFVHSVRRDLVRIGRDEENDVALDDLLVSRSHAELRRDVGGWVLVDLDSHNGTFVNGRRIDKATIGPSDLIAIGDRLFLLRDDQLVEHRDAGEVGFAASDLAVVTGDGRTLLDGISFALDPSCFLGVVGTSGAGKSTLLGALTGYRPATSGAVYYAGRDLYREYDSLRRRIGFVPQDDLVQLDLTVFQSLKYAAKLRFAPDVSVADRNERVEEVLRELGLDERRDLRVRQLSGGQRKRVSVALELLTKPALLFLDEPTSGLDPGFERNVMQLLRDLADGGRVVVCVTHSVESLNLCDRVLCLAPGGRAAYFGPPQIAVASFGRDDWHEVFQELSAPSETNWKTRFEQTAEHDRYVEAPLSSYAPAPTPAEVEPRARARGWLRQLGALTSRYARSTAADRRTLIYLVIAAPILGLVLLVRVPPGELERLPEGELHLFSRASVPLLLLAIAMTQLPINLSVREIVKELAIFKRERAVGLSISAYLSSKVLVLGVIGALQAAIVMLIGIARQGGPSDGSVLSAGKLELFLVCFAIWIAGMALGLLVSAVVSNEDRLSMLLPAVLGLQVLALTGSALASVPRVPGLDETAYVSSATYGYNAMASTARLNELNAFNDSLADLPLDGMQGDPEGALATALAQLSDPDNAERRLGDPSYNHDSEAWGRAMAALGALTLVCLVGADVALRRHDPL
ncbi:MAG: FHA domain-containing protein [Actinomycetota bacterium]